MTNTGTPLERAKIGDVVSGKQIISICLRCGTSITASGECSYDCSFDEITAGNRPRDTVRVETWATTSTLMAIKEG